MVPPPPPPTNRSLSNYACKLQVTIVEGYGTKTMGDITHSEDKLLEVACTLRLDDKVSVVFLLTEEPETSLHVLRGLTSAESPSEENGLFKQHLLQLMVSGAYNSNIPDAFVEALAIIQNYRVGRLLGFSKQDMLGSRFVGFVNPVRKHLYLLADSLTEEETCSLMSSVNGSEVKQCRYLEEAILEWQLKGVVNVGDFDSSSLETIEKHIKTSKGSVFEEKSASTLKTAGSNDTKNDCYKIIDATELGLCIVVNNTKFTRNNDLINLMPSHELPARPGSERDVEEIEAVFTWLRFRVAVHENVSYNHLQKLLASYSSSVTTKHSFLVLIFMSHGTEDVVYTADSVPVSVEALEMAFQRNNCPQLTGKPKILIIQACQGTNVQRVMMDSGGYEKSNMDVLTLGPERGDALIAWSTVKGYASFRDRTEGSWFIQELCRELRASAATRDLVEIVTRVNDHLRSKTLHGVFMVPSLSLSLCRKIRLI